MHEGKLNIWEGVGVGGSRREWSLDKYISS